MVEVSTEAGEQFHGLSLLSEVDPEVRSAVLGVLAERTVAAGALLLTQGQPNDHLCFLVGGSATVERKKADGQPETLATLRAPTLVGTTSFFTTKPPNFSVRAATEARLLTLDHPSHDRLRRENPRAAEALAVAALRVLSERFEELDRTFSTYIANHPDDQPKVTEWAGFRARLFQEPGA
ncbi:MAG: cyclic nucleotide-binding domain-containing protein [Isosphaeraceae bacterium]